MPLIKSGRPVEDPWAYLDDDAPLPGHGPVIVGVARWQAERERLRPARAPGRGQDAERSTAKSYRRRYRPACI